MLSVEASTEYSLLGRPSANHSMGKRTVRGGWLADEMGMGKTAVCCALMLAAKARDRREGRHKGLTVVLVNNSLVGQWVDELHKFAPGLRCARYYGTKQARARPLITPPDLPRCL